ncbi:uncharacterized protein LOC132737930 [Ruditapes philippinarum]|uniref:uncharacterized protein LOC132737930 n=1 Tax=Ruditapes philippinarum TaxID=129788 RepID=UPI00295B2293|nr:uncharacterized protein LOC132737930 [Ruditapes philippinarum]
MLLAKVFLVWMFNAVFGWMCPSDVEVQRIYVKTGEKAVISFQTSLKSYNGVLLYSVVRFDHLNVYSAVFYENVLQNEKSYLNSEFIGDANTGNFTVRTASVKSQDGGTYMLRHKEGTSNMTTEECAMLYILDKPKKATVYHDSINIQGNNSTLTCTSISTTYPTNHTLNLTYNWIINNVSNPSNQRYVYSSNKKTIFIKSVDKEDANMKLTCSATEFGDEVIGYTSDESEMSLFVVIYGPEKNEINTTSPYIIMEGDSTETIKCKADCYPSCACVWRNESSGSSIGENGSFVIRTISKYQSGNYTCTCTNTAKDKIATEQTSSLYIKVEYNSKRSPIADNSGTNTCDHTWMIVGIIFGLLCVVMSGYAVYVTILLRRTNIRKGEGGSAGTTDPAYYEKVEEDSKTAENRREPGSSNTDEYENSVKMYTDLVRYSKDEKQTYDIIQSNK